MHESQGRIHTLLILETAMSTLLSAQLFCCRKHLLL